MKKQLKVKIIFILAIIAAIISSAFYLFDLNKTSEPVEEDVSIVEPVEVFNDDEKKLLANWKKHKSVNDDYRFDIIFDSEIINLPVVQGETNEAYERVNWETMEYDEEGSIFMDYECTVDSSNITIYGHYVYPSLDPKQTHKFSPLTLLLDEENYKENSTLMLVLEDEIRYYQVAYVYYCQLINSGEGYYYVQDDAEYYLPEYEENYFNTYMNFVKSNALYDTGVEIKYGDNMLTLQTCVRNRDDKREIVVCKEISRKSD